MREAIRGTNYAVLVATFPRFGRARLRMPSIDGKRLKSEEASNTDLAFILIGIGLLIASSL